MKLIENNKFNINSPKNKPSKDGKEPKKSGIVFPANLLPAESASLFTFHAPKTII